MIYFCQANKKIKKIKAPQVKSQPIIGAPAPEKSALKRKKHFEQALNGKIVPDDNL